MPNADAAREGRPEGTPPRRSRWVRLALILALVAGLIWIGREGAGAVRAFIQQVDELGAWAAVAYIATYLVATVAWVPGSVLTLAAGAIFGLVEGTLYTLVGATGGAALAFLVSRYLARDWVERRIGGHPRLQAIDDAVAREGWKVVFLVRLSPAFPFNALNYAFGLTRVRFRDYVLASAPGMLPGTFLYVYAGYAAGRVATGAEPASTARWVLLAVGLAATVAVTVLVTRSARRALERRTHIDDSLDEPPAST